VSAGLSLHLFIPTSPATTFKARAIERSEHTYLPCCVFFSTFNSLTMPPKEKYSDPKLRDEVKEEIHNSDKGGAPGQWSARKAQMMASE